VIVVQIAEPRFVARKDAQLKESPCRLSKAEDEASGEAGRRDAHVHCSTAS